MADALRRALDELGPEAAIAFTAHSIPTVAAATCAYEHQLRETAQLVVDRAAPGRRWALAWQSRSGPPTVPWLEPDINDHLRLVRGDGATAVAVVPIGFVADHMEIVHDLDTEAAATARDLGLRMVRTPTAGTDPRFVAMVRELVEERLEPAPPPRTPPPRPGRARPRSLRRDLLPARSVRRYPRAARPLPVTFSHPGTLRNGGGRRMNHAQVAAQALRYRFCSIHGRAPDPNAYDVDAAASRAVTCGDPVVDSAIRRLVSALSAAGVEPSSLIEPWERPEVTAVFTARPELLDLVDEIVHQAPLQPAG